MKKIRFYLTMLLVCSIFSACDKEEYDYSANTQNSNQNNTQNNGQSSNQNDNNSSDNDNGKDITHSFFINTLLPTLGKYEAGSTSISFETDAEWEVSLDASNFEASASVSQQKGKGNSTVTIYYGEAKDKYNCSTSLLINFTYVSKEYKNGGKDYSTKSTSLVRRYNRIKP